MGGSSEISSVFGTETLFSSEWISLGGPVKGSFVIKNGVGTYNDYISDFGMSVEDPCQAIDNSLNINFASATVKDLKYHTGSNSQFWIPEVCQDSKALLLVQSSAFPFLELRNGNLAILSAPPNPCTRIEIQHAAPDDSVVANVFYLTRVGNYEAAFVGECSSDLDSCYPNVEDLVITSIAGKTKTIDLIDLDSLT